MWVCVGCVAWWLARDMMSDMRATTARGACVAACVEVRGGRGAAAAPPRAPAPDRTQNTTKLSATVAYSSTLLACMRM